MAEIENDQSQAESTKNKKLPLKTMLVLLVFLIMEAGTVILVLTLAGRPPDVQAESALLDDTMGQDEPVEELVIDDRFVNTKKGETILYDTEVYVVVRQKYREQVKSDMEAMRARISTDIANIIRRAQPAHFTEPTHATLARQIKAALDRRLSQDPLDDEPMVMEVLINKMIPFKADN